MSKRSSRRSPSGVTPSGRSRDARPRVTQTQGARTNDSGRPGPSKHRRKPELVRGIVATLVLMLLTGVAFTMLTASPACTAVASPAVSTVVGDTIAQGHGGYWTNVTPDRLENRT